MWSDLALDPSFKVKRWFPGFGESSFRWIQIFYLFSDALGLVVHTLEFKHLQDSDKQQDSGCDNGQWRAQKVSHFLMPITVKFNKVLVFVGQ